MGEGSAKAYGILKINYEDLKRDFELMSQRNKTLKNRIDNLQSMLIAEQRSNRTTNLDPVKSIGVIKTTIMQESPEPKEQIRMRSIGKTYTKVTVGKERLVGEKRYVLNADGTKKILG